VKRERLEVLAENPFYTKRFAHYVGRRCRAGSIKDIAQELNLDWDTVKTLEKQYMAAQLAKAGTPGPKAIGIDEISPGGDGHVEAVSQRNQRSGAAGGDLVRQVPHHAPPGRSARQGAKD
jgi:hypothetical protein